VEWDVGSARVFIIDEHEAVRSVLAERLNRAGQLEVVGHTGDANQALVDVRHAKPDVVLLEVKRSDGLGLELVRQVSGFSAAPIVAVLTSYPSNWEEQAASRAGASLYMLKEIDTEELIRCITGLSTG
jgi:DNA-binding NarL/FixJ family response regulator